MDKLKIIFIAIVALIAYLHFTSDPIEVQAQELKPGYDIVMFGTDWCPYCAKARDYFEQHNVDYFEYNIETDRKGREYYDDLGGGGIPIVVIGDQLLRGYSSQAYAAALKNL